MTIGPLRWVTGALVGTALALASVAPAAALQATATSIAYAPITMQHCPCPLTWNYVNPPLGSVVLGGVPFSLANADWVGQAPHTTTTYTMSYGKPLAVDLLINSANTYNEFAGQALGYVRLGFADGTTRDTPLVIGVNLREWAPNPWMVSTLSGTTTRNVWSGTNAVNGGPGVIDTLTIQIAQPAPTLTSVSLVNTASWGLSIMMAGLTVVYDPWHRPGHSWETPAATKSQAPLHAKSANFTGVAPAQGAKAAGRRGHRHGTYVVVSGDTLWGIARKEGVSLQALLNANPQIKNRNLIRVGQRIKIP